MPLNMLAYTRWLALILLFAAGLSAQAASIDVDAYCGLSDAIRAANTDTAHGGCMAGDGADTINLRADIRLTGPLPEINSTVTINGGGHTLDGGGSYRILDANNGSVSIFDLRLQGGNASAGAGGAMRARNSDIMLHNVTISDSRAAGDGGGIYFQAASRTLSITNSVFQGNATVGNRDGRGGGLYANARQVSIRNSVFAGNMSNSGGGAIYNDGSLQIDNSAIHNNSAAGNGGGIYAASGATTAIIHATFVDNSLTGADGAGESLYNAGAAQMHNSVISRSEARGGSLCANDGALEQAGNLIKDNSCSPEHIGDPLLGAWTGTHFPLLEGSKAVDAGSSDHCAEHDQLGNERPNPGCDIGAVESNGPVVIHVSDECNLFDAIAAANTNSAAGGCRAGRSAFVDVIVLDGDIALEGETLEITSPLTIEGEFFAISGESRARIFDITDASARINNLTISGGRAEAAHGGAIRARNSDLTLQNVTISGSVSGNNGGGLYFAGGGNALTIDNSNFIKNMTDNAEKGGKGGAVFVFARAASVTRSSFVDNSAATSGGAIYNDGALTIENATISGNSAADRGGGLHINEGASATLIHATLYGNSVTEGDGAGIWRGGAVTLYNTILAGDVGDGQSLCAGSGGLTIAGNLIEDGSCASTHSGKAGLGALTGSPLHHPLAGDSRAIDAALPEHCLLTDQTGRQRPQHLACDIGAFEILAADIIPSPTPTPTMTPTPSPTATATPTPTATPEPSATPKPYLPPGEIPLHEGCSLNEAIRSANSNSAVAGCAAGGGADTITLIGDVQLDAPLESIASVIHIAGAGYSISGGGEQAIFTIASDGDLSLSDISLMDGASGGSGGAARNMGRLTADRAFFGGNSSVGAGGAVYSSGYLSISNSAFAWNASEADGGAIFLDGGAATLTHLTLRDNLGGAGNTAGLHVAAGSARLRNSLIAGATGVGSLCAGSLQENLGNFVQDGSCEAALSGGPKLEDLSQSPGSVPYFALDDESAAVDAGDDYFCSQYPFDQRNEPRRSRDCNIGAVEAVD